MLFWSYFSLLDTLNNLGVVSRKPACVPKMKPASSFALCRFSISHALSHIIYAIQIFAAPATSGAAHLSPFPIAFVS